MHLIKPYAVNHDGSPVYSISVDPSGAKFATSGSSKTSTGLVMIWDLQAALLEGTPNERRPLLLCRMEAHSACVNCVRWSSRPHVFATGGSDSLVMVWAFAGNCPSSSGFEVPPEYWKCTATMAGHTADVLDVDWSPGDRYLASCSVDNSIIVWNARKFPERITTLNGHGSIVKGVRFDPIGKYLASQSEDKTLRIWSTSEWTLLETIKKPFEKAAPSTHMLRLDWSPDGLHLASAHAMNNGGPVSKLIERNEWTYERDFVGHRKAVTCTRWSPAFYRINGKTNEAMVNCLCATGSKDRTLCVWSMSRSRPLVVLMNVFAGSIMDMSWTANGTMLLLSSCDGNIACCEFTPEETGTVLSSAEKVEYLKKIYGCINFSNLGFDRDDSDATSVSSLIIENPQFLAIHRAALLEKKREGESKDSASSSMAVLPTVPVQERQVETRTSTGKRRIVLTHAAFVEPPPKTAPNAQNLSAPSSVAVNSAGSEVSTDSFGQTISKAVASKAEASTVLSTENNDGISPPRHAQSNRLKPSPSDLAYSNSVKEKEQAHFGREQNRSVAKKVMHSQATSSDKRRAARRPFGKSDHERARVLTLPSESDSEIETDTITAKRVSSIVPKHSAEVLSPLKKAASLTQILAKIDERHGEYTVSMENHVSVGRNVSFSQLLCSSGGSCLWKFSYNCKATAIRVSNHIVAVLFEGNLISVLSISKGRALSPMFSVSDNVNYIDCRNSCLFVVLVSGELFVWSFEKEMLKICHTAALPLLRESKVSIENVKLTDDGKPLVSFSDGKSFLFDSAIDAWLLIVDSSSSFFKLAAVRNLVNTSQRLGVSGPLCELTKDDGVPAFVTSHADMLGALTENFFEMQMQAALALRSKDEYKYWLMQYVKNLVDDGNTLKLRCVLQFLDDESTDENVASWPKRQLLNDLLPLLCVNPKMEPLYVEYCGSAMEIANDDLAISVANSIVDHWFPPRIFVQVRTMYSPLFVLQKPIDIGPNPKRGIAHQQEKSKRLRPSHISQAG
uniref:Protein HIRA n=1 Tax=Trichuris muris TaxID=70415 RepID=A0A5S6QGF1_TRIMR